MRMVQGGTQLLARRAGKGAGTLRSFTHRWGGGASQVEGIKHVGERLADAGQGEGVCSVGEVEVL